MLPDSAFLKQVYQQWSPGRTVHTTLNVYILQFSTSGHAGHVSYCISAAKRCDEADKIVAEQSMDQF
jgi:hypothetical protein